MRRASPVARQVALNQFGNSAGVADTLQHLLRARGIGIPVQGQTGALFGECAADRCADS